MPRGWRLECALKGFCERSQVAIFYLHFYSVFFQQSRHQPHQSTDESCSEIFTSSTRLLNYLRQHLPILLPPILLPTSCSHKRKIPPPALKHHIRHAVHAIHRLFLDRRLRLPPNLSSSFTSSSASCCDNAAEQHAVMSVGWEDECLRCEKYCSYKDDNAARACSGEYLSCRYCKTRCACKIFATSPPPKSNTRPSSLPSSCIYLTYICILCSLLLYFSLLYHSYLFSPTVLKSG